jgi:RNA polymerase primary sigma factor
MLLTAVAIAQAGANNTDNTKTKSTEHHSKLSKVAFWRHHNDANKNAKQDAAKPATSEHAQPKAAQVKPAAAKQSQSSKTQVKPVSAKQPVSKTDQKQNTTKTASPSAKRTTAKAESAPPKKSPQESTTAPNTQGSQKDSSKQ